MIAGGPAFFFMGDLGLGSNGNARLVGEIGEGFNSAVSDPADSSGGISSSIKDEDTEEVFLFPGTSADGDKACMMEYGRFWEMDCETSERMTEARF